MISPATPTRQAFFAASPLPENSVNPFHLPSEIIHLDLLIARRPQEASSGWLPPQITSVIEATYDLMKRCKASTSTDVF